MTERHLRYGIVGCGMMGREHIRNINLLDNASIAAILEPDADMRSKAAKLAPDATFVEDVSAMAQRDDIDALVIASPNHLHIDQIEMLSANPRPLLVEKPLYTDTAQAARLEAIAASYKAPVWVAMEYRYMPAVRRLIDEIPASASDLKMLTIREHRFPFLAKIGDWNRFNTNTGGTLVEKCCHFFDLMRLITGGEAVRVMASAGQAVNHLDERYQGKVPDIWDHGFVLVDFDNGKRAMLELCMFAEGSRFQEKISAIGSTGMVEAFVPGPTRFWPEDAGPPPVAELVVSPRSMIGGRREEINVDPALLAAGDHNGATFYQHERFAAVARGTGKIEVGLDDGAKAVAIGLAAQASAASGKAVMLD